jgi:hypothetical protein
MQVGIERTSIGEEQASSQIGRMGLPRGLQEARHNREEVVFLRRNWYVGP